MKTFRQFISIKPKKIPYKMAPGGKAWAKRSSSSAGGNGGNGNGGNGSGGNGDGD